LKWKFTNRMGRFIYMLKHIIWDFDGTLFDTYPTMSEAFIKTLRDKGIEENCDRIMSLMKISESNVMEYVKNKYCVGVDFKEKYDKYRIDAELKNIKPFPYVEDICKAIYLSGRKNYLYTHRSITAIEFLKRYNLYEYFHDFVIRENNFKRKPDPEGLLYLIKKNHIEANEALMIGDREIDIMAAKNAGIHACYFDNEVSTKSQLADYNISDMKELFDVLKNS